MSGASAAAAFITLFVVFMIGMFTMCILKKMSKPANLKKTSRTARNTKTSKKKVAKAPKRVTNLKHYKMAEMAKGNYKDQVYKELNGIPSDSEKAFVMYLPTCGYCHKLINEVLKPMDAKKELPMPMTLIQLNQDVAQASKDCKPLGAMMAEAKGVPTTVVMKKKKDGKIEYGSINGFMPGDKYVEALKSVPKKPLGDY